LQEGNRILAVKFAGHSLSVVPESLADRPGLSDYAGKESVIGLRPEAFEIEGAATSAKPENTISCKVNLVEQLGSEAYVHFALDSPPVITPDLQELMEDQG